MSEKKIILVTTIYNRANYLEACLESSLRSTLDKKYWVHLLIDNASTDGANKIAKEYCDKHDHMYFVQNDTNIGQMPAYNFSLAWVQEKFPEIELLSMLDSDDLLGKLALEKSYEEFVKHPELSITYSDFNVIDKKGKMVTKKHPKSIKVQDELTKEGQAKLRRFMWSRNIATHFRMMKVKEVVELMGGFNEDYPYSTDYSIYMFALDAGMMMKKVDATLYNWRTHKTQVERQFSPEQTQNMLDLKANFETTWKARGWL